VRDGTGRAIINAIQGSNPLDAFFEISAEGLQIFFPELRR
jgi:hypothetical protein